jgi:hypothetical protein
MGPQWPAPTNYFRMPGVGLARYAFDLRLIGGTKRCRAVFLSGV